MITRLKVTFYNVKLASLWFFIKKSNFHISYLYKSYQLIYSILETIFFYLKYIYLTGIYTLGLTTTSSPNVLGRTIMFVSDMVARPAPGSGNHARKYCRSRNLLLWIVMVVSLSISHLIFSRDVSLAFLFFSFIASSLPF